MTELNYQEIEEIYGIRQYACQRRFQKLGIKKKRRVGFRSVFCIDDVEIMANMVDNRYSTDPKYKPIRVKPHNLRVMELFFTLNDNRTKIIAEMTGFSYHQTAAFIDNYFSDGGVVVQSKMNDENFEV